jgi:hypothetical protein
MERYGAKEERCKRPALEVRSTDGRGRGVLLRFETLPEIPEKTS